MPSATARRQDAALVQFGGNGEHSGGPLGPQVIDDVVQGRVAVRRCAAEDETATRRAPAVRARLATAGTGVREPCASVLLIGRTAEPFAPYCNLCGAGWRAFDKELPMCDYSLHNVASRPAKVGDRLTTRNFGTGTCGFAASEDARVAVCVLPGTELAFAKPVEYGPAGLLGWIWKAAEYRTAIFRQVNRDRPAAHHDALEFPDGKVALLTSLKEDQEAVVLQLLARPENASDAETKRRVAYVG